MSDDSIPVDMPEAPIGHVCSGGGCTVSDCHARPAACPPAPKRARATVARIYHATMYQREDVPFTPDSEFSKWLALQEPHLAGLRYLAGQIEMCPTTSRLHFQFLVVFKSPVSFKVCKARLGPSFGADLHVEAMQSDFAASLAYVTKKESHVGGPFYLGKDPVRKYLF